MFVGHDDATLDQDQFNIPQAQVERVVQPDSMADYLDGGPMTVVRVGGWFHPASFARLLAGRQTWLT
jgi:hypothetical protein